MPPIVLRGTVLLGQGRGKETGLQTANLDISLAEKQKLKKGLYHCEVKFNNSSYRGLLYYGHNSLSQKDCLEVHLLDFNQNIYQKKITVFLNNYIRPPKKFSSFKKLSDQLKQDLISLKDN